MKNDTWKSKLKDYSFRKTCDCFKEKKFIIKYITICLSVMSLSHASEEAKK